MNNIRLGYVSAVDKVSGMVAVIFPDEGDATTDFLPYLSPGREFFPPEVDEMVLIAYTDQSQAVVLGTFWNKKNLPPVLKGAQKNFSDKSYIRYDATEDTIIIHAANIVFECDTGTVVVNDLVKG